jgi:hypothetical protein
MRIWLDSDMTNIKFVTDAVNMAESRNNGLMYATVGAKTTSFTQPLDVGASFKCKKAAAKQSGLGIMGSHILFADQVEQCLEYATAKGELKLKSRKREIIKNVLADAPEIQARAFGGNKVQQAYVSSGFIDGVTFSCTDINQVMAASKVNWNLGVMSRDELHCGNV